jgi:DNA-binding MarR family transcriptional regulator
MTSVEVDFNQIKEMTNATSGNISVQISKLQEAGYIEVVKSFKNNYQNTSLTMTKKGIKAFEDYVNSLKQYIKPKR